MPKTTRYDEFSRLIRRDFERAKTFTNDAISANGSEVVIDAAFEGWRDDNSTFAQYRPYNGLSIDNDSTQTIRVYLRSSHDWFVDIAPGESRRLEDGLYFNYVEVEELDGGSISADEIEITVAKHIDSRELRLLEMAGMLNVGGR